MTDNISVLLADATKSLAALVGAAKTSAAGAHVIEQALVDLVAVLEQRSDMGKVIKAISELKLIAQAPAVTVNVTPHLQATIDIQEFRPLTVKVIRTGHLNLIDTVEIFEKP